MRSDRSEKTPTEKFGELYDEEVLTGDEPDIISHLGQGKFAEDETSSDDSQHSSQSDATPQDAGTDNRRKRNPPENEDQPAKDKKRRKNKQRK
jgi:hypothetical protein